MNYSALTKIARTKSTACIAMAITLTLCLSGPASVFSQTAGALWVGSRSQGNPTFGMPALDATSLSFQLGQLNANLTSGGSGPLDMLGQLNAILGPASQTFVVTNLNDSGAGSLRQAILDANLSPGYDLITFQLAATATESQAVSLSAGAIGGIAAALGGTTVSTINLTSGELEITDYVAIIGPGADRLSISGGQLSRVLSIHPPATSSLRADDPDRLVITFPESHSDLSSLPAAPLNVVTSKTFGASNDSSNLKASPIAGIIIAALIGGLTITNGKSAQAGGGILSVNSSLLLHDTIVTQNSVTGDNENGGGIFTYGGSLDVVNSTISCNSSNGDGGGLASSGAPVGISNSTISNNTAVKSGGGLSVFALETDPINISNSTVSDNSAQNGQGGGIYGSPLYLVNATVSNNSAAVKGGGIFGNVYSIGNSMIANNPLYVPTLAGINPLYSDYWGYLVSRGNNLFGAVESQVNTIANIGDQTLSYNSTDLFGTPENPLDPQTGSVTGQRRQDQNQSSVGRQPGNQRR